MRSVLAGFHGLAVLALLSTPALAAHPAQQALDLIAAAKAASGGAAWDRAAGWHETGTHGAVAYETELDLHHYGSRFKSTRGDKVTLRGFDGTVAWDQGADGKIRVSRDPAPLASARQTAYLSASGFFFANRFPAKFEYLGEQTEGAAEYDAIRVAPEGAKPFDIWIDRATHFVTKFIDRYDTGVVVGTASDFRDVDGLKIPFAISLTDGDPAHNETAQVQSVTLAPISRADFSPPAGK